MTTPWQIFEAVVVILLCAGSACYLARQIRARAIGRGCDGCPRAPGGADEPVRIGPVPTAGRAELDALRARAPRGDRALRRDRARRPPPGK